MEFTAAATWLNTAFAGFDNAILEFMHRLEEAAGGFVTPLAKFITLIGEKGLWMFALAFVLMLFARTRKLGICLFGAVCCGALITNIILKDLIARPRPFEAMAPFLKYWKAVGSPAEDGFSFPSGHVTAAAAGMSAIMFVKGRKWILPAAGYVFLMCFSRNYLMAHYPSDVLAASLVGLISGFVAYLIGSFIWEYIDDNDDLPFFRTLRHFSLPLPDVSGVTKKLNRVPSRGTDKKEERKAPKAAKKEAPRGRHSAAEPQGRHSAPRHAARAAEPDFELDQFDEDIDIMLDESLEDEVKQGIQNADEDDYEAVIRASRRSEESDTHAALDTDSHKAVTGRHQAVGTKRSATGVFEATGRILRAERTGSHEAVRTGSHEAVRTGRHAAAPAADKKSAGKNAKAGLSFRNTRIFKSVRPIVRRVLAGKDQVHFPVAVEVRRYDPDPESDGKIVDESRISVLHADEFRFRRQWRIPCDRLVREKKLAPRPAELRQLDRFAFFQHSRVDMHSGLPAVCVLKRTLPAQRPGVVHVGAQTSGRKKDHRVLFCRHRDTSPFPASEFREENALKLLRHIFPDVLSIPIRQPAVFEDRLLAVLSRNADPVIFILKRRNVRISRRKQETGHQKSRHQKSRPLAKMSKFWDHGLTFRFLM